MSSSLLLQQCTPYLVCLIWMLFQMGGRWPYICCFVGCYFRDLLNISNCSLVQFPCSIFSIRLVSVYVVHAYSRIDTTASWKKLSFILSDFHMIDNLSIAVHAQVDVIFRRRHATTKVHEAVHQFRRTTF